MLPTERNELCGLRLLAPRRVFHHVVALLQEEQFGDMFGVLFFHRPQSHVLVLQNSPFKCVEVVIAGRISSGAAASVKAIEF